MMSGCGRPLRARLRGTAADGRCCCCSCCALRMGRCVWRAAASSALAPGRMELPPGAGACDPRRSRELLHLGRWPQRLPGGRPPASAPAAHSVLPGHCRCTHHYGRRRSGRGARCCVPCVTRRRPAYPEATAAAAGACPAPSPTPPCPCPAQCRDAAPPPHPVRAPHAHGPHSPHAHSRSARPSSPCLACCFRIPRALQPGLPPCPPPHPQAPHAPAPQPPQAWAAARTATELLPASCPCRTGR